MVHRVGKGWYILWQTVVRKLALVVQMRGSSQRKEEIE